MSFNECETPTISTGSMQDSGEKSIRLAKSSTSILRHRQAHEITTGRKFVSLTDFIEQFDWEYSDLDIVDRREIKHLAAENFRRYIAKSEVPLEEPGHLSAVMVAKGIEYGVNLLGCFIEGYVGSNQALGKEADFGKLTQAALEVRARHFRNLFRGA
jgi:hypothetical protein